MPALPRIPRLFRKEKFAVFSALLEIPPKRLDCRQRGQRRGLRAQDARAEPYRPESARPGKLRFCGRQAAFGTDQQRHAWDRRKVPRMTLLVGPEGGLSPAETQLARSRGFRPVRLGPRILRTETAALAALSAIQAFWGDFQ